MMISLPSNITLVGQVSQVVLKFIRSCFPQVGQTLTNFVFIPTQSKSSLQIAHLKGRFSFILYDIIFLHELHIMHTQHCMQLDKISVSNDDINYTELFNVHLGYDFVTLVKGSYPHCSIAIYR
jgi:hypothetical protein